MGKIPSFTDSEWLTSKTDCVLKVYKDKEFISLDSRFVDLENTGERATLFFISLVSVVFCSVIYS